MGKGQSRLQNLACSEMKRVLILTASVLAYSMSCCSLKMARPSLGKLLRGREGPLLFWNSLFNIPSALQKAAVDKNLPQIPGCI